MNPSPQVLYVEDHPANIDLMKRLMMERPDIDFLAAETGTHGLALAIDKQPELILLDWNLPDITAEAFIQHLRLEMGEAISQIVVVTADVSKETMEQIEAARVDLHVPKPFDLDFMLSVIDSAIQEAGSRRVET